MDHPDFPQFLLFLQFSFVLKVFLALFLLLAAVAIGLMVYALSRGEAFEFETTWGVRTQGLGGWWMSPALTHLILAVLFTAYLIGAGGLIGAPESSKDSCQPEALADAPADAASTCRESPQPAGDDQPDDD